MATFFWMETIDVQNEWWVRHKIWKKLPCAKKKIFREKKSVGGSKFLLYLSSKYVEEKNIEIPGGRKNNEMENKKTFDSKRNPCLG